MERTIYDQYAEMVDTLESPPTVIKRQIAEHPTLVTTARLLHAGMGCATESGELMDQLKKHIVYGKPLDLVNVQEELGDILWYIQLACNVMGVDMKDLMMQNMRKLRVRFGDKFDFAKVLDRDLSAERSALEGDVA